MEVEVDEKDLKAAGAELFADGGRRGVHIHGWLIESRRDSILNSSTLQESVIFASQLTLVRVISHFRNHSPFLRLRAKQKHLICFFFNRFYGRKRSAF